MIWSEGAEFQNLAINGLYVEKAYLNGELIYIGIRSCYGSGAWINSKPYLNDDAWKN